MNKMIQIRHVPEPLHRKLKAPAAVEGMALSDYLLREVCRAAERPTLDEIKERLARRRPVAPGVSPASENGRDRRRRLRHPRSSFANCG
jgi:antitoxin FitA